MVLQTQVWGIDLLLFRFRIGAALFLDVLGPLPVAGEVRILEKKKLTIAEHILRFKMSSLPLLRRRACT